MPEPRILVIGEKFIDRYYVGTATRLSPEAPIPVVAVKEVIQSAGGAGNVSANLASLGADVVELCKDGPIKNRLVSHNQQLARWDENDQVTPITLYPTLFEGSDAVVISDYGKGAFNCEVAHSIHKFRGTTPLFIDTKNPTCWPSAGNVFFFPNMKEWQTHKKFYEGCSAVIRTESENGMTYLAYGEARWHTPTLATDVVSVCGAGDTAIAAFAYHYCKEPIVSHAMRFASKACAVVCGKPYTATASHEEINKIT